MSSYELTKGYQKMAINNNIDPRYGLRIKACRLGKNMSQEQLGDEVGTSKPYICKIENAKQSLTSDMARRMAEVFSVRWEYLMLLDDYRTEEEKERAGISGTELTAVYRDALKYLGYSFLPATEKPDSGEEEDQKPTKYLICREGGTQARQRTKDGLLEDVKEATEVLGVISPEEMNDLMNRINAAVRHEIDYALQYKTRKATEGEIKATEDYYRRREPGGSKLQELVFRCR